MAKDTDPLTGNPKPGRVQLVLMTIFSFPMAVIWSTMALVILPAEALWLFPTDESFFLGVFLVIVGISQLVCPIAGLLSDRHRSRWGRRRPFILGGTAMAFVFTIFAWWSSATRLGYCYMAGLFLSQVFLNVIYCAQSSIVPDFFDEKKGEASGIVAGMTALGNLVGMVCIVVFADLNYRYSYPFYLTLLFLAAVVVLCCVSERATDQDAKIPLTWSECLATFTLDLEAHRDFFWVCVGRTFYYMSTSCLTWLYYFLRDMLNVESEASIRRILAITVIIAMVCGLLVAWPLGILSDRWGRKPLVYISCALMATVFVGFCILPFVGDWGLTCLFCMAAVYGMGSSCYQSVDYALALDCLPQRIDERRGITYSEPASMEASGEEGGQKVATNRKKGDAEALGLWGIAGFLGSALGPLVGGVALEVLGGWGKGGYEYPGYCSLLLLSALYAVFAAVVTKFIVGTD